jgi:hypothetical protein
VVRAIYYPYSNISNPILLKNALLLWDSVQTIVPRLPWSLHAHAKNRTEREACDLILEARVPSRAEQTAVAKEVQENLATWLLQAVAREDHPMSERLLIYPEKFLSRMWETLKNDGLATWEAHAGDYGVPPLLGLFMLSALADACAGTQIQKITDQVDAYTWLGERQARALGAQYIRGLDPSQVAPQYERLISISLEVVDARTIPLKKLVELRKRESKEHSSDYGALRRRYHEALRKHVERIGKEAKTIGDVRELESQFKTEIDQDVRDLKNELGVAAKKTLFSKEIAMSALAVAGAFLEPISGLTGLATTLQAVGVTPLLKTRVEYREARKKALRSHAMSWLFVAKQPRVAVR